MSMMYGSFVRKIAKISLTSSTIHIITIIVSLCVICIVKLNHIAKLLCITKINFLMDRSLKASQHLGSWNSNTKPKLM